MTITDNPAVEIPRDRYGRPLIIPPGGGDPIAYTRASTMARALDDMSNLMSWKQRVTAVGLHRRPDLRTKLAGLVATSDNPVQDWPAKRDLNALCKEAAEAGGATTAASEGTGLHALTEAVDRGATVDDLGVDPGTAEYVTAYQAATAHLDMLDIELFVVNDQLQAAGTFDRLVRLPDGRVVVADLKTGKHDAGYPLGVTVQIATYANAARYNPGTGERLDLHRDLDRTTGLLLHMPQLSPAERAEGAKPVCSIYTLDLTKGWEAAQVAAQVHQIRRWKADTLRAVA